MLVTYQTIPQSSAKLVFTLLTVISNIFSPNEIFLIAFIPPDEAMSAINYRQGFKHLETWKICTVCAYEYLTKYGNCPICKADTWNFGKRLIAECRRVNDTVEAKPLCFIFETAHCDVRVLIIFIASLQLHTFSSQLPIKSWYVYQRKFIHTSH